MHSLKQQSNLSCACEQAIKLIKVKLKIFFAEFISIYEEIPSVPVTRCRAFNLSHTKKVRDAVTKRSTLPFKAHLPCLTHKLVWILSSFMWRMCSKRTAFNFQSMHYAVSKTGLCYWLSSSTLNVWELPQYRPKCPAKRIFGTGIPRLQNGRLKSFRKWAKCCASLQTERYMLWWSHCCWWRKASLSASLSSTVTLGLLLLHFDSRTIFFTCRSPSGRTNIVWLVVWGRDHRNCTHATIYIHTNMNWLQCMISTLALRCSTTKQNGGEAQ